MTRRFTLSDGIGYRALLPFLPAIAALAAWLFWLAAEGGYFPRDYLPAGLIATVLVGLFAVFGGAPLPKPGVARIALLLLVSGVALSFLSILWADSPGAAFDASVKLGVLLAVTWLVAITPWTPRSAATMLGAWAVGAAVIAAIALAAAAAGHGSIDIVRYGRFAEPIGYTNGVAALGVMAFLPALALAARSEVPVALQGLLLASACFLLELALLPQSRAALVALACGTPLLLAISPGRVWLLLRMALVAAVAVLAIHPVLEVYEAANSGGDPMQALRSAWNAMAITSLAAGALGVGAGLIQRRTTWRPRVRLPRHRTVVGIVLVTLIVVGAAGVASRGGIHIGDGHETVGEGGSRISSLDPEERIDYWRVALDMFDSRPLEGRGAGSFEFNYARDRHQAKPSRYVHNVFLRTLSETGVVGLLLLLAMLGAIVTAVYRVWRFSSPLGATVASACFVLGLCFLIHDSLDWMDEIPALAGPALGLPLVAASLAPAARPAPVWLGSRRAVAAVAAGAILGFVAIGSSWLATLYLDRASSELGSNPNAAFADYGRAASLQPWSSRPLLAEGVAAIDAGRSVQARAAFEAAIRREDSAFPHLELALLAAEERDLAQAQAQIETAAALEPRGVSIRYAQSQILARKTLNARVFNGRLLEVEQRRFTSPVS